MANYIKIGYNMRERTGDICETENTNRNYEL